LRQFWIFRPILFSMEELNAYLATNSYLGSSQGVTQVDYKQCKDITSFDAIALPHLNRWHVHVSYLMSKYPTFDHLGVAIPAGSAPAVSTAKVESSPQVQASPKKEAAPSKDAAPKKQAAPKKEGKKKRWRARKKRSPCSSRPCSRAKATIEKGHQGRWKARC